MSNVFAPTAPVVPVSQQVDRREQVRSRSIPDYTVSISGAFDHFIAVVIGFAAGFLVLHIFFQIMPLSIAGGGVLGFINIFVSMQRSITRRREKLRTQFFDLLEAMSVAMRAGNPPLKALESAKGDLALIYPESSDIMIELNIIIDKFNNAVPLSDVFDDFAKRSGIEDIASFASIYATIEGKSSRADEIVRETQTIIADKMEIEMEIETMMAAAKNEANIMLIMPLVVLGFIGFAGSGFMDALFTTRIGRGVSAGGLVVFIICFIMVRVFSNIKV